MAGNAIFPKVLPLVAIGFLAFAVKQMVPKPAAQTETPFAPPAQTLMHGRISGIGIIEPYGEAVHLGCPMTGIIDAIHVKTGDHVTAQSPLFSLDARQVWASIGEALAQVESARVAREDAAAQLAFYTKIKNPAAISQEELSRRKFALKAAEAAHSAAKAQLHSQEILLKRMTVVAPLDGEILHTNVRVGEAAAADPQADLMIMGDTRHMQVRVEIDEMDAQRLEPSKGAIGMLRGSLEPIPLEFSYREGQMHPKVSISGSATELIDTRILEVIYRFDNTKVGAYSGQQMDVFINAKE